MAARLPKEADLSPEITCDIVPPPQSQHPSNILILLHGIGDTHDPFTKLARNLNLPETAAIPIRGPNPLPFELGGYHWGDDIMFDSSSGNLDAGSAGVEKAVAAIKDRVVKEALIDKCSFKWREILIWGFGQGASVALSLASSVKDEMGGIIAIGGALPADQNHIMEHKEGEPKSRTPILLCKGRGGSQVTEKDINGLRKAFEFVEIVAWDRSGDGMPQSRDEMMPIMRFFARRLRSRKGVPAGAVEIS